MKEGLNRLLSERRHDKRWEIPVKPPQRRNAHQQEQADDQEEGGMADEMIVRVAKDHAKGDAKRRPDLAEPVEREPEDAQDQEYWPSES